MFLFDFQLKFGKERKLKKKSKKLEFLKRKRKKIHSELISVYVIKISLPKILPLVAFFLTMLLKKNSYPFYLGCIYVIKLTIAYTSNGYTISVAIKL